MAADVAFVLGLVMGMVGMLWLAHGFATGREGQALTGIALIGYGTLLLLLGPATSLLIGVLS